MRQEELVNKIQNIAVWKKGGKRAPHKPLLLLLAIRYLVNENKKLIMYSEIEMELSDLLMKYGPERKIIQEAWQYDVTVTLYN